MKTTNTVKGSNTIRKHICSIFHKKVISLSYLSAYKINMEKINISIENWAKNMNSQFIRKYK